MKTKLIAKIEVPLTELRPDGNPMCGIGTGYPVRDGLVLTARHVLYPDKMNPAQERILSWYRSDEPEPYHQVTITEDDIVAIAFEGEDFDVALIKCDTAPLGMLLRVYSDWFPQYPDPWTSYGYPRAGKEKGQRIKTPAGGKFFDPDPDYYVQQLMTEGDAAESELWKGMSGAPVFHCQSGMLMGVLIRTPNRYKATNDKPAEVFKERLVAASIPYFLQEGKCPGFRQLVWNAADSKLVPPVKLAGAFEKHLARKIARELSRKDNDTKLLCEQLMDVLDLEDEPIAKVAEKLVELETVESIDYLSTATEDCVAKGGMRSPEVKDSNSIKAIAQQILGWLVLGSFDEQQLGDVMPHCVQHDSLFFVLGVNSLTGVEVVMARRFDRSGHFRHETGSEQRSPYLIAPPVGSLKWDKKESVNAIFVQVWNRLFRTEKRAKNHKPQPAEWGRLNAELAKRRKTSGKPEHYYMPFKASDYVLAELEAYVVEVYREFLKHLDQMTVIQYGAEGNDRNLFVIQEDDLQAAINDFYRRINEEDGQTDEHA